MAVLAGKLAARRSDCAPLAGKSTLNRLELSRPEPTRYHKISYDGGAIERVFVDLFLEAYSQTPQQITLDPDATDDPPHGHQEGRFFHGYAASHRAVHELKAAGSLSADTKLRSSKYLNNLIEQDHRA
jgi:hypothetical protein